MAKYDVILFDLDGTISDSAIGIKKCIELTLEEMGKEIPNLSDYSNYVGPPLVDTFHNLCKLDMDKAYEAIIIYRKYYQVEGVKNNSLFKGMYEVLQEIKKENIKMVICTSKTEHLAREVLDYLNIEEFFDDVCGSLPNGKRKTKVELIKYVNEKLNLDENAKLVLIGDTKFDARGAIESKIDFIGASYGYGKTEDIINEGAKILVDKPEDILKYV